MNLELEFKKYFGELEAKHVLLRNRVNAFPERDGDLEARLSEEIEKFEAWRFQLTDELACIVAPFNPEQKEQHRQYVRESTYYEIVQEAPFYWRIINKPNGYAGDAYMMKYIYENRYEGETPFGKFLHKHALTTKPSQSVRNRKVILREELLRMGGGKVISLAAGPAEEIKEILNSPQGEKYQFLALDHDMSALESFHDPNDNSHFNYALANAFQIISQNYQTAKPRMPLRRFCFPRKDFRGWRRLMSSLKYEMDHLKKDEFDFIYSAGLYDYIKTSLLDHTRGTIALTKNLFDLLKPGGILIVGNFNYNNPRDLRFIMEYVLDWQLIYRNKEDMFDFARSIPENTIKEMEILNEPSGVQHFLKVIKKA
jgi:extracellular factor (EF) 3-hydroxypalmitic acid methyl ester biosynthesis protein